jgi:hypothetical protein
MDKRNYQKVMDMVWKDLPAVKNSSLRIEAGQAVLTIVSERIPSVFECAVQQCKVFCGYCEWFLRAVLTNGFCEAISSLAKGRLYRRCEMLLAVKRAYLGDRIPSALAFSTAWRRPLTSSFW